LKVVMDQSRGGPPPRLEFDGFVADAGERLLRSAYLITWDLAEAEDLVQECLFKVARKWPRVRTMAHPVAYARTVLVHLALDDGKRRNRRRAELQADAAGVLAAHDDDAAVRVLGRVEASADLLRALAQLPPRQRAALVLRYFEDLSEAEVASVMRCSVGTVKSTTWRALERLREAVDRPGDPAEIPRPDGGTNTDTNTHTATSTSTTTSTTTSTPLTERSVTG
jgi:RNA polymerase sigma-70 factor (sigma-E family)